MIKRVLILGFGKSGRALSEFALKKSWTVSVLDKNVHPNNNPELKFYVEGYEFEDFCYDLILVSPGVDKESHYVVKKARALGVSVLGEAEFALSMMKDHKIIAVTGSNGKSTTTMLIAHILKFSGYPVKILGNIGTPLISAVDELKKGDVVVAELSSFQLEGMKDKVFDIGVLLNLTPNHLDRHHSMENYLLAKLTMMDCMKDEGVFFVQDKVQMEYKSFFQNRKFISLAEIYDFEIPSHLFPIRSNLFFARRVCKHLKVKDVEIYNALASFQTLEHRLEYVCDIKGVRCYNDSKSTTIDSVLFAVESLGENIILICGGRHKGGSFSKWNNAFHKKVKAIFIIGEAKEFINSELKLKVPIFLEKSLDDAIEKGLQLAKRGDNLILSPGCSSLDMFSNFEERGYLFKRGLERESKRYDTNFSTC